MRHLIAISSLLLVACAAPDSTTVASAAAPASAASAPEVKMVCHREEQVGTNMKHTVCEPANKDSWDAQQIARGVADQAMRVNPSAIKPTN